MRRHWSVSRLYLTTWILGLAFALLLGLSLRALPALLNLNAFRPRIQALLEQTYHCHVLLGNVQGQLFPPGLNVGHVVLLQESAPPRILAAVDGVHLWISLRDLWKGKIHFKTIRFRKPRIFVHREITAPGEKTWVYIPVFSPATAKPTAEDEAVMEWQIREGRLEIWDHAVLPTEKWVIEGFTGDFNGQTKIGVLTGKAPHVGPAAYFNIRYDHAAGFPITIRLVQAELSALPAFFHVAIPALKGRASFLMELRFAPALEIRATLEPLALSTIPGIRLSGAAVYTPQHFTAHLQSGATTGAMTLAAEGHVKKDRWDLQAIIEGYDSRLVRAFYAQTWINRLEGPGSIAFTAQSGSRPKAWRWTASGEHFRLRDTAFSIPAWSAQGDAKSMTIDVQAQTAKNGSGDILWTQPAAAANALLTLDFSSVTVHEVLEIFNLQATPAYGYEPWLITDASLGIAIDKNQTLTIQNGSLDVAGMHADVIGTFGLAPTRRTAHLQGAIENIPVAAIVESFSRPPSPISGTGKAGFDLTFPLTSRWVAGLNGALNVQADNGVLKQLKTIYRIMSVLNLGNYLRLRLPQVSAQGIVFNRMTGHFVLQNGVLQTDDLFFKSPNMNVGVKGTVDIPQHKVDTTVRLEMFRFLEDILRDVPITHWIFKKPSKIFLPLVVKVTGPWDNLSVD